MTTTAETVEYALMAGASYISTRSAINQFPVPQGWTEVVAKRGRDDSTGFEATYFIKGAEIVISYAGTYPTSAVDQITNAALALGLGADQLRQAADYYLQVKAANPNAVITLTGHSLGGGLAALIGVFFGVRAYTFDQAPFANSAENDGTGSIVGPLRTWLMSVRNYTAAQVAALTDFLALQAANGGIPNSHLVTDMNVQGEFLSTTIRTPFFDRIGTTTEEIKNSRDGASGFDLHAQALLVAYLQSRETASGNRDLDDVTFRLTGLLKIISDPKFYSLATDGAEPSFLEHLVRHQTGGIGGVAVGGDAMVTRFTTDLWKLADAAGLSKLAQDALIAQGIEGYYWQRGGYMGQPFFDANSPAGLLQYTSAQGQGLANAENKAAPYVRKWLAPIASAHGSAYFLTYGASNDQWNVLTSDNATTVTARDNGKSQVFVGQGGADNFTGGDKGDLMFAGTGNEFLFVGAVGSQRVAANGCCWSVAA